MTAEERAEKPKPRNLTLSECLLLVAAVCLGAAAASALSKPLFQSLPTDISRVGVILDALADDALQADIAVLGNSVTMAGIDARSLRDQITGKPIALNMGTNTQEHLEAYLYYQELPDSVDLIVLGLDPWAITHYWRKISSERYNALFMYGYRPDAATRASVERIFGADLRELFNRSDLAHRFESRRALFQAVERVTRSALGRDRQFTRANSDLYFPRTGEAHVSQKDFVQLVERRMSTVETSVFRPVPAKTALLREFAKRVQQDGKQIVFLLMPQHPALLGFYEEQMYPEMRAFYRDLCAENGILLIDAVDLLSAELYYDSQHPDEAGAAVLTATVADRLNALIQSGELEF